jgi:HTH-type transcriptional regulator, sugar sensing transcriptional regulator
MTLKEILINIGLNQKEAAVYLATLELGDSPVSEIAFRAKHNRVSTYDILKKLKTRGFVSSYIKARVTYFAATDPDLIRMELRKKYMDFKGALPDLRRLHGKTAHPHIRYYEGLEGIKKVYSDTLNSKTEILNYADSKSIRSCWPTYDDEYVRERVRRKIYLRGISPRDEYGEQVAADNPSNHREIRLVEPDKYEFANEINIYDDKVSIISFGKTELVGMIIESPEIANTQRAIFMMAWQFAAA